MVSPAHELYPAVACFDSGHFLSNVFIFGSTALSTALYSLRSSSQDLKDSKGSYCGNILHKFMRRCTIFPSW